MNRTTVIHDVNVIVDGQVLFGGAVELSGDRIIGVYSAKEAENAQIVSKDVDQRIHGAGGWLVPGFIDLHVHGGFGHDFMDASIQSIAEIATFHAKHGTTSMLATTMTASKEDIDAALAATSQYVKEQTHSGAAILGVHLEGPFISPKWPGAQNPAYIVSPNVEWLSEWTASYPGLVKQLTLAPEAERALETIKYAREQGIIAACGHTDASYETVIEAADHGLNQAVHTYNAMTGLHHRQPGTVGAVLSDDRIMAEIIADGHHVHPGAIKVLYSAKSAEKIIMITDAMSAAGLGDGQYSLGGLDVTVKEGVARLTEGDSLAGSTLTTIDAFKYLVKNVGISIEEVSLMSSANPAKQLGLDHQIGHIQQGYYADLVWLSPTLELQQVWCRGQSQL